MVFYSELSLYAVAHVRGAKGDYGMPEIMDFTEGSWIYIPCASEQGGFPDERVILIDTGEKQYAGFVDRRHLRTIDGQEYLMARVIKVSGSTARVKTPASFFTAAAGSPVLPVEWMNQHVQQHEAVA